MPWTWEGGKTWEAVKKFCRKWRCSAESCPRKSWRKHIQDDDLENNGPLFCKLKMMMTWKKTAFWKGSSTSLTDLFIELLFVFYSVPGNIFVVPLLWSNQAKLLKHSRCTVKYPEVSCPVLRLFESASMKLLDFFKFPPEPAVRHFWTLRSSLKTNSLPMK